MNEVDPLSLDEFEVYKLARQFRKKLYALARSLPEAEKYNLRSQMQRASLSVTANIAEGHGRFYYADAIRFYIQSRGSVSEIIDELNLCLDEAYGDQQEIEKLKQEAFGLIKRINGYIAYLRNLKKSEGE